MCEMIVNYDKGSDPFIMINTAGNAQPPEDRMGALAWKCCVGCGCKISDRFLLFALDGYWHFHCLKCSCCQAQLAEIGSSCFTKCGLILCKSDYIRLFGNSGACMACRKSIPASEMVMRTQGNVFHVKCFICSICHNQLVPGDRFHYVNGKLFCERDTPAACAHRNDHLDSLMEHKISEQKI
ncbi:LIM domain transcription factor LMO4 isoform X1 [Triplophysa rosa]|uniref:LIM domain transcription factor LMO4 n=1 Tax=Triplophysa rosa TaxID=992332 RepID=A0A9W7W7G6_TRIRA|nr:LIM domain transcription factor LMO4 isoform X1 [Triplophysa rosa]KAI7789512.1 LIM domain transcription factor LMO4 [Triplophysa rosa]